MRRVWLPLCLLVAVASSGCFNTTSVGSHSGPLTVGLAEVGDHSLRSGSWDWEVRYEHDSDRTTGEIQVFMDLPERTLLLERVSIAPPSGAVAGAISVEQRTPVRVMLEVFTTSGGQIELEWKFVRDGGF